ncbi:MAG: fasciclin domain-containing protein [Phycisphaerales bacterium]|nr:fasciclin domain-containing protein [Phycisphaerales bacterium]
MFSRVSWKWFGVALPVALVALAGFSTMTAAQDKKEAAAKDIVDTAIGADNFKTLCSLLEKGDLVAALKGKGPFTVFAPTDEAFKKLDKATLESLAKPENKSKLQDILKYHVISGKVTAADVLKMDGKTAKTLQGGEVRITVKDGKVMVDGANVTKTDIVCANGVIHVIDAVITPAEKPAAKPADKGAGH